MYLKLADKLCPREVARMLCPGISDEDIEWDYENVYEWVYVDLPGLPFLLDVNRDHGQSAVDDDRLDSLTNEELANLPSIGPTYITGIDRDRKAIIREIAEEVIQQLSDKLMTEITVYLGGIDMSVSETEPSKRFEPQG